VAHLYEAAGTVSPAVPPVAITGPAPLATILAGAVRCEIREISVSVISGTAGQNIQLGRPAAAGTGGSSAGALVQATDGSDAAGQATLVTTFVTTQPTAPAAPMRQYRDSTVAGCGFLAQWDAGEMVLAPSGQLVIWLLTGTAAFDVSVRVAE
jgi:hypothetical protein